MKESKRYLMLGALVLVSLLVVGCGTKEEDNKDNSNKNNVNSISEVVDADYVVDYKNAHRSNEITTEGENIKVPYFKFDTEDAKKVNDEIKKLYNKYESQIKSSIECEAKDEGLPCGDYSIGYKVYTNSDTISVLVLMQSSGSSIPEPEYLVYNFNKDGKLLSLDDLLKLKNKTKEELIKETKNNILALDKKYLGRQIKKYIGDSEKYLKKNINSTKSKVSAESGLAFYLNNDGNFNAVTTIYSSTDVENPIFVANVPYSA